MQQSARMRMRPWLEEQINSGVYPGVKWLDSTDRVFQVPWKHAARHGWSINRDATLFRGWAMHTGKYHPGRDPPDPKTWKANFRCALNSLSDVKELSDRSQKKGSHAYRVYRMLPDTHTHPRRRRRRRKKDRFRGVTDAHTFYLSTPTPLSATSTGTQHASLPRENDSIPSTPHNPCWPPEQAPYSYGSVMEDCPSDSNTQQARYATACAFGAGGGSCVGGDHSLTKQEQEQEEAVFKLVDHLNTSELWFHEDQGGLRTHPVWEHCYGGDSDCLSFPMQTDHYTPTIQQTLLLLDNVTVTPAPVGQ